MKTLKTNIYASFDRSKEFDIGRFMRKQIIIHNEVGLLPWSRACSFIYQVFQWSPNTSDIRIR
jgi:hypothetical protein